MIDITRSVCQLVKTWRKINGRSQAVRLLLDVQSLPLSVQQTGGRFNYVSTESCVSPALTHTRVMQTARCIFAVSVKLKRRK